MAMWFMNGNCPAPKARSVSPGDGMTSWVTTPAPSTREKCCCELAPLQVHQIESSGARAPKPPAVPFQAPPSFEYHSVAPSTQYEGFTVETLRGVRECSPWSPWVPLMAKHSITLLTRCCSTKRAVDQKS